MRSQEYRDMDWGKGKEREKTEEGIAIGNAGEKRENDIFSESRKFFENQADIRWLTTKEAAEFLRISSKSLLNLTSNGRVRYYKFGRSNRFLLRDLHQLLLGQPRGGSHGN